MLKQVKKTKIFIFASDSLFCYCILFLSENFKCYLKTWLKLITYEFKGVFGLGREFEEVNLKWFERKVRLFGLGYVRVYLWIKFIEVCNWCDIVKDFLIFLKCKKYKFIKGFKNIY